MCIGVMDTAPSAASSSSSSSSSVSSKDPLKELEETEEKEEFGDNFSSCLEKELAVGLGLWLLISTDPDPSSESEEELSLLWLPLLLFRGLFDVLASEAPLDSTLKSKFPNSLKAEILFQLKENLL